MEVTGFFRDQLLPGAGRYCLLRLLLCGYIQYLLLQQLKTVTMDSCGRYLFLFIADRQLIGMFMICQQLVQRMWRRHADHQEQETEA